MMIINPNAVMERHGLPAEALGLLLSEFYSIVLKYLSIVMFKFSSQSSPGEELTRHSSGKDSIFFNHFL